MLSSQRPLWWRACTNYHRVIKKNQHYQQRIKIKPIHLVCGKIATHKQSLATRSLHSFSSLVSWTRCNTATIPHSNTHLHAHLRANSKTYFGRGLSSTTTLDDSIAASLDPFGTEEDDDDEHLMSYSSMNDESQSRNNTREDMTEFINAPIGTLSTHSCKKKIHQMIRFCKGMHHSVQGAEQAERLLHRFLQEKRWRREHNNNSDSDDKMPELITRETIFNMVMDAWSRTSSSIKNNSKATRRDNNPASGPMRAESILRLLQDEAKYDEQTLRTTDNDTAVVLCKPTVKSYNTVINAYAKMGNVQKARSLLREILGIMDDDLRPDQKTFHSVIMAHANSGDRDAGQHAEELLTLMKELHTSTPSATPYPDVITHSAVINAYAKMGTLKGAEKAHDILESMLSAKPSSAAPDEGEDNNTDPSLLPDTICFTSVINGWAKCSHLSSDAPERAKDILNLMLELRLDNAKPSVITWNTVINAYASSKRSDRLDKATGILETMLSQWTSSNAVEVEEEEDSTNSIPKPSTSTFNTVLKACSRIGNVNKAEEVVHMMKEYDIPMDNVTQCSLITTYAYSKDDPERTQKAQLVLHDMIRLYEDRTGSITNDEASPSLPVIRPTVVAFSAVISACAHFTSPSEDERKRAYKVAHDTFETFAGGNYGNMDPILYASMVRSCGKLLPLSSTERETALHDLFKRCCQDGLVDGRVLKEVQLHAGDKLFFKVFLKEKYAKKHGGSYITPNDLPADWSMNADTSASSAAAIGGKRRHNIDKKKNKSTRKGRQSSTYIADNNSSTHKKR